MSHRMATRVLLAALATTTACASYVGRAQEVTFSSTDGVDLHGSLVFPEGAAGGVPAVVVLHGAESATRSLAYRMHANIFLKRGFAVLLYDKRGAGASGGDHDSSTYAQLIGDALAAIRFTRSSPGVDPDRIGLVGTSESGWFTPEIAETVGDLAFVINKVGPCASVPETIAWESYNEILDSGASADEAAEQVEVLRRLWAYRLQPSADEEAAVRSLLTDWKGREHSQLPEELRPVSAAYLADLAYDPSPYLERLATPMLYVYGRTDINIPTALCERRLTELQQAGRPITVHVFEDEGHELGGLGITGYKMADGYAELLGEFAVGYMNPSPGE